MAAFGNLLRTQRTGLPLEELALYLAELAEPPGLALAQAIHAAKLGPDPASFLEPGRPRISVGVLTAEELVAAATDVGPLFEPVVVDLRRVPPPQHVRILLVSVRAAILRLPVSAFWRSREAGVS
jgi:hypothetical protein